MTLGFELGLQQITKNYRLTDYLANRLTALGCCNDLVKCFKSFSNIIEVTV